MDFTWSLVSKLEKTRYNRNDIIYHNNWISNTVFFIHAGKVKLHADNGYSF